MSMKLTPRYKTWCHLIDQLGQEVDKDFEGRELTIERYSSEMDKRLLDNDAPLTIREYRDRYGSEYTES